MYNWSERSLNRMKGVNEHLCLCATISLMQCKYDMLVAWKGGLRTEQEQFELFKSGVSKCDGIKKQSAHQKGNALDITPVNSILDKELAYLYFAKLMFKNWQILLKQGKVKGLLSWGGLYPNMWDKPHWEVDLTKQ